MIRWAFLLALTQPLTAQGGPGVEGNWLGTLDTGPVKLRLVLKVAKAADGSLSAKMDSLDQGAKDLPVSSIVQNGMAVKCELQRIGGICRHADIISSLCFGTDFPRLADCATIDSWVCDPARKT